MNIGNLDSLGSCATGHARGILFRLAGMGRPPYCRWWQLVSWDSRLHKKEKISLGHSPVSASLKFFFKFYVL